MIKPTKCHVRGSSEDSDQPGRPPRLISVFAARMKKQGAISYSLSADAQADLSLRWVHMSLCWFCHALAQWRSVLASEILGNGFTRIFIVLLATGRFCFGLRLIQAPNKPAGYHSGSGTCRTKTISYLDISSHFFRLNHLVPSFIMGFNSLMLFFYVSKLTL